MFTTDFILMSGLYDNAWKLRRSAGPAWPLWKQNLVTSLEDLHTAGDEDELRRLLDSMKAKVFLTVPELNDALSEYKRLNKPRWQKAAIKKLQHIEIPGYGTFHDVLEGGIEIDHVKAMGDALKTKLILLDEGSQSHVKFDEVDWLSSLGGSAAAAPSVDLLPPPHTQKAERTLNAWILERPKGLEPPLVSGEPYTLNFNVGVRQLGNLLPGNVVFPESDIPPEGLKTNWVIVPSGGDLVVIDPRVTVTPETSQNGTVHFARFELFVPKTADSDTITMTLIPRVADLRLHVSVFVAGQLYRSFDIVFQPPGLSTAAPYLPLSREHVAARGDQMNLAPPYEWTTPPGELTLYLNDSTILANGDVVGSQGLQRVVKPVVWPAATATLAGLVWNVRSSAEDLRSQHGDYFDAIDLTDLDARITAWTPDYDWNWLNSQAVDQQHQAAWNDVAVSSQMRDLADAGYRLFLEMCPVEVQQWLTKLPPGYRLNLVWLSQNRMLNFPFGLMYIFDPPASGPIDPMGFAALRFRVEYTAHPIDQQAKDLGTTTNRVNVLFTGSNAADPTWHESEAQRTAWQAAQRQIFVPLAGSTTPREEIVASLRYPQPAPVSVLYLFCVCSVGRGNNLSLDFVDSMNTADAIRLLDLGNVKLQDNPLVFANACTTAGADPYIANLLEDAFFKRKCRAYLGAETKVPIRFASRFATIFFRFFERKMPRAAGPISAGEALAQTRLFLWTRYRNIGGILYSYINQYELFLADAAEIETTRRKVL